MATYNFTKLNEENVTVQGRDFLIEDKTTGKVYVTDKKYIDKLFDEMGYRNLNVIKVLEEYAGKYISEIGSLRESSLFVDEDSSSFVVLSEESLKWVNTFFDKLKTLGASVIRKRHNDDYHLWDEYIVRTKDSVYYALFFDLCKETVTAYILKYDDDFNIIGMKEEAEYHFSSWDDMTSLLTTMMCPADISSEITLDAGLSMYEYAELMKVLGYLKGKRGKKYAITDKGEESVYHEDLEQLVDDINVMSWLQRRIIRSILNFEDACKIICLDTTDLCLSKVYWLYRDNIYEKSDMFSLEK